VGGWGPQPPGHGVRVLIFYHNPAGADMKKKVFSPQCGPEPIYFYFLVFFFGDNLAVFNYLDFCICLPQHGPAAPGGGTPPPPTPAPGPPAYFS